MQAIDLDRIESWPGPIVAFLAAHSSQLRAERTAEHEHVRKGSLHRIRNPAPPMTDWQEAKRVIAQHVQDRDILAFHATKLINFTDVMATGLNRLDLATHLVGVKSRLVALGRQDASLQIDPALQKILRADRSFKVREGGVWMTPLRRHLHDGGCDVFFESYGGEALERMAGYAGGTLAATLKEIGKPAVVIARIPVTGWCSATELRIAQSMIELFLEQEGNWEPMDFGWDVLVHRHIPTERIVSVVSHDDENVRWPV